MLGQRREMVVQIEVALGADAEIEIDVLRQRFGERPLDDRLDRRHARAAGDGDDRPAMALAQIGGAERAFDPHAVADLELLGDIGAGRAARGAADMELEHRVAGHVGHRIVARRAALEGHRGELAGREVERPARHDGEPHALDVVRGVVEADHPAGQDAARMDDQVVLLEPGHLAVRPRHGAAGEDQAARLLLVRARTPNSLPSSPRRSRDATCRRRNCPTGSRTDSRRPHRARRPGWWRRSAPRWCARPAMRTLKLMER